jgi:hypothetical protein
LEFADSAAALVRPKADHGSRVATGREAIAREKANAERLSREINAEIEALILGTKRIGD